MADRFDTPENPSTRAFRLLLFAATVVILLLLMPRESRNSYNYEVNRPWTYSLLTAPFDVPILLDSVSSRIIRDSINRNFEPVYTLNPDVKQSMVDSVAGRLNRVAGLTYSNRNNVLSSVRQIYDRGVIPTDTYTKLLNGEINGLRTINRNVAVQLNSERLLSPRVAYTMLDSMLSHTAYRQVLSTIDVAELLQPNMTYDSIESMKLLNDAYLKALAPRGVVQQGERIIDRGDIVTPALASILDTYERMMDERMSSSTANKYYPIAGQALYLMLIIGALYAYLHIFRPDYYRDRKKMSFILLMIVGFTFFAFAMNNTTYVSIYMVPLVMVPIMSVIFLDSRTAMFIHLVQIVVCSLIANFPLEFFFMQFIAGSAAIDSIKDLSRRSQLLRTALIVFLAYCLTYVAIDVIQTGTIAKLSPRMFGSLAINAVLVSFAYVLMFIFERMFGFTSRVTLVELSDINNPLLRELSEECPGTFQHSMSVSNLAAAAALRIGANVQLVRAGALYHDIGKTANPAFFTENQHGVNPHNSLTPEQSAGIVIDHVKEGMRKAERAGLPKVIRNFITEHHGKGKAKYFYTTWCNAHPGESPDEETFTYPGPNPQSRETSILMMADSVEAASRSLKDHNPDSVRALVHRIIDTQIAEGLHNDSTLSFRDVQMIKDTFVSRLGTMFHSRISYPELKKPLTPDNPS